MQSKILRSVNICEGRASRFHLRRYVEDFLPCVVIPSVT